MKITEVNIATGEVVDRDPTLEEQAQIDVDLKIQLPESGPSPVDRLAEIESRLDAGAALADKANATAQEVAQAARDGQPPKR
jgi:hypothetical protein